MIRIAVGYVAVVVLCAVLILLNPMDFMGKEAREAMLKATPSPRELAEAAKAEPAPESMAATTAAILADLQAAKGEAGGDPALARMSQAALAGLRGEQPPRMTEPQTLEALVALALAEGETDAAIDAIVNQAVAEGKVEAPAMLRTTKGRVDTAVLLASVLADSSGTDPGDEFGQGDVSEATVAVDGGTLALQVATQDLLYIVKAGDSLGALALRFYGDADLHHAIFKANRQVLDTPESLRGGMKLLIPARSGL